MVSDRMRGIYNLCLICYLAVTSAAYWSWVLLYNVRIPLTAAEIKGYLFYNEILLLGFVWGFKARKSNYDVIDRRWSFANTNAIRQAASALFAVFVFITAFHDTFISRLFLFSFIPIFYVALLVCNRFLPTLIARQLFLGDKEERIVLVGPKAKASRLRPWLKNKEQVGFRTLGILSEDQPDEFERDYRHLGAPADLEEIIRIHGVTQAILVELPLHSDVLHCCIQICEKSGIRLLVISDLEEQFRHSITLFEDDGRRFIGLRDEPLENPFNKVLKRCMDIAIAFPVTVLILPLATVLVWAFQRFQSSGPVFFVQPRAGLQNREFKIFKYRTMHLNPADETIQATHDDVRIFPAGQWLRKFSMDELPQFFNVLRGDMSIVGPRPHLIQHNELFSRALNSFHLRASVKPGITGLAQVRGFRGGTKEEKDIVHRVNSDIYYLENWSFSMDCYILLRTIGQVLFPPKSAY